MNRKLYFECYSGISGDMAVAALLDLGVSQRGLVDTLGTIPLSDEFRVEIKRVIKSGLDCCDFNVILKHDNHDHDMEYLHSQKHIEQPHNHSHRGLSEIIEIIEKTELSENAKSVAKRIFMIIARAEAKAHGVEIEKVHFHEVGAVDSIVDIIAFAYCFDKLGINEVVVPYLCEGVGSVRCRHGILPVPVPAVVNITSSEKIRLKITDIEGELVTPTGAAIVGATRTTATLPEFFTIEKTGLGAGKREYKSSGILRAMIIK